MLRRPPPLALLWLALLLSACGDGGGDEEDVQQVVRDFVTATNERDGETLCRELLTLEFQEKATGAEGDKAIEACEKQLELTKDLKLKLVSVGRTSIDGDRARVRAVLNTDGVQAPRLFQLEMEDGNWKLASGQSG